MDVDAFTDLVQPLHFLGFVLSHQILEFLLLFVHILFIFVEVLPISFLSFLLRTHCHFR